MVSLLHLSDLHFSYDADTTARTQRALALDGLASQLCTLPAEWRPKILVISGDLTWQGKKAGFKELGEWLSKKLFPATGLTVADCVICPGNHDIDREAAIALLDRTGDPKKADQVLRPERLANGFAKPFGAFVRFAESFGISAPRLHDAPNYLAGLRELRGIQFVCANSAWFCRDSKTDRGELWLGLPQLQSMPLMNPDDYDTAPIAIAVLHHPQEWFADSECNAYEGRPNTYGYLAERTHAILSGHTHGAIERATRCYDRARLFLGGATYDYQAYRNNFSLLRINPSARTITRRAWEFDPRKLHWDEKKSDAYSLRTEIIRRGRANPTAYIAWLRDQTQFINLHQLKVGPGQVPPPAIDSLYIRLKTAAPPPSRGDERAGWPISSQIAEAQLGLAALGPIVGPQPLPLEEALRNHRLVIEGKPGGGKTTFVRWIAWMLSRPMGPPAELAVRGFPLLVRISQLDQHITNTLSRPQPGDPTTASDARWIMHFLASQGWDLDEEFFREKLDSEDTLLLLDGLDEAANERRRELIVETIKTTARFRCRIVVTTRPGAHEGRATLVGFDKASIEDLDDTGIDGFLSQWCRWLKRGDEAAARAYYAELRPAVVVPSTRILARNPLMLTALAVLHLRRQRLPEQRAQLYEQIMDWLADQAVEKHPEHIKDELLRRFGALALGMQEWKGGQKLQIGIDTATHLLTPPGEPIEPARHFLEQAQIYSGIVTLRGGEIAFWHRSFQEYLAARTLAGFRDGKLWERSRNLLFSPEGREVLPLLAGCMVGSARERLDDLFENLTSHAVSQSELVRRAHAAGVLGSMLADVASARYALSGPAKKQFGQLRDSVMAIFERGRTKGIGLKTRVAAAEALDQASQSRLRTPSNPDYWVEIAGGTKPIAIPAFQIGRFPVTVWEYSRYLDNTNANPPDDWDEQSRHPSRPVTHVSWHDAKLYCEWAGCQLPSDPQWEFAARGREGRIYPWGSEAPDEFRANFGMMVGELTPVGMFPDGDTPEGVADLTGNVLEWTRSDYDKEWKRVRGARFNDTSYLTAASITRAVPGGKYRYLGFRCIREHRFSRSRPLLSRLVANEFPTKGSAVKETEAAPEKAKRKLSSAGRRAISEASKVGGGKSGESREGSAETKGT